MYSSKKLSFFIFLVSFLASNLHAMTAQKYTKQSCATSQSCKDLNNNCKCYCSRVCHFRDKFVEEDTPYMLKMIPMAFIAIASSGI